MMLPDDLVQFVLVDLSDGEAHDVWRACDAPDEPLRVIAAEALSDANIRAGGGPSLEDPSEFDRRVRVLTHGPGFAAVAIGPEGRWRVHVEHI